MSYRKYRLKANLTQQQLADLVGTSKQHISQIENFKKQPSLKLLMHLSIILNVCINQLLGIPCNKNDKTNCSFQLLFLLLYHDIFF